MILEVTLDATVVFVAVVGARFVLPLVIPRYPLAAIVGCLVLDAVDQTVFQAFGYDPPGYQSYDKAMDVFYLAIAYLATMRNWTSLPAVRVARFLYYYRVVGVLAFERLESRALLLVFPNTFEYFFIAYEVVRLRWDPAQYSLRLWIGVAAAIWVFVKLPQEWWIHIAQLDFTDAVAEHVWFGPAVLVAVLALVAVTFLVVLPRLDPPDRRPALRSDPLPRTVDEASERAAWVATHGRVKSLVTVENRTHPVVRPCGAEHRVPHRGLRGAGRRQHRAAVGGRSAASLGRRSARPGCRRVLRPAVEPDHGALRPLPPGI